MKRKKSHLLRNFFILVTLGLFIYMGYFVFEKTDVFIIKDVSIIGNDSLTKEEVMDHLEADNLHYFKMNIYEVNEVLEKHPVVKNCIVKKVFPDRLEIAMKERLPVLALAYTGQYLLVDEEMVVVEVSSEPKGYYVIEGHKFTNFTRGNQIKDSDRYLLKNSMDLIYMLLAYNDLEDRLIFIEDKNIYILIDDFRVNFGEGEYMEEQFNNFRALYKHHVDSGMTSGIINVRYKDEKGFKPFGDKNEN